MTATGIKMLDEIFSRQIAASNYAKMNVGRTMLSRDGALKGVITGVSSRYCAGCGMNHPCYLVTWENGRKTKPCTKGCKEVGNKIQIA